MQEAVKNTEIAVPFVFFDGTSIPAGSVKMKKGDHIWLFLDRCRKVGAELGVGGADGASKARKEWARISVDDLMLVKGDVIVPHVSSTTALCPRRFSTNICIALRVLLFHRQPSPKLLSGWRFALQLFRQASASQVK